MSLAAKEIVCVPIRYENGELVYESAEDWTRNPKREGYVAHAEARVQYGPQPVADKMLEPLVQAKAGGKAKKRRSEARLHETLDEYYASALRRHGMGTY